MNEVRHGLVEQLFACLHLFKCFSEWIWLTMTDGLPFRGAAMIGQMGTPGEEDSKLA